MVDIIEFTPLVLKKGTLRPKSGTKEYALWYYYRNFNKLLEKKKNAYHNGYKYHCYEYNAANKDKINVKNRKWKENNPTYTSEYMKNLRKTRPGYIATRERLNALKRKQRFIFKPLLPSIEEIYKNCPKGHVVDHIIPLQGKEVSGLHAPWNLQYLTISENNFKRNKFDNTYNNIEWKNNYVK